jgi:enoyl-CoA hydratase/carnithine racemase
MSEKYFRVSINNFVAELVLNRPGKLNVVDFAFFEELGGHLKRLESDEAVRVVLIWAEGRLFTAGLDLNHAQKEIFGSGL